VFSFCSTDRSKGKYSCALDFMVPDEVIRFFQFTKSFQPHYGPGVESASNRNEYQLVFMDFVCRAIFRASVTSVDLD
jgi:hypothetical protein